MTDGRAPNRQAAVVTIVALTTLLVVAVLLNQSVVSPSTVAMARERSELRKLRESTFNGSRGDVVIATGIVVDADGEPCADTDVAISTSRSINGELVLSDHTSTTDRYGRFRIRANFERPGTDMLVALTPDGRLGLRWFPTHLADEPLTVKLMPGRAEVHVVDVDGNPIPGAIVDVHETGIDDISEPVPLAIRRRLRKRTGRKGVVEYPSRLGDHPLGFTVIAKGREHVSTHFTGYDQTHLFVVGGTYADQYRLQEGLAERLAHSRPGK